MSHKQWYLQPFRTEAKQERLKTKAVTAPTTATHLTAELSLPEDETLSIKVNHWDIGAINKPPGINTLKEWGQIKAPSGKYPGLTFEEVFRMDQNYICASDVESSGFVTGEKFSDVLSSRETARTKSRLSSRSSDTSGLQGDSSTDTTHRPRRRTTTGSKWTSREQFQGREQESDVGEPDRDADRSQSRTSRVPSHQDGHHAEGARKGARQSEFELVVGSSARKQLDPIDRDVYHIMNEGSLKRLSQREEQLIHEKISQAVFHIE